MLGFQESLDGSLIRAILSLGGTSWTEHQAGSLSYSNYENGNHKPLLSLPCASWILWNLGHVMKDIPGRDTEEDMHMSLWSYLDTILDKCDECVRYLDEVWQHWRPLMEARKASALHQFRFKIPEERVDVSELYWSPLMDHNFLLVKKKSEVHQ